MSAAVGMVEAKTRCARSEPRTAARQARPGSVVAVIGDGALTGGMAYEALNHAGHLGTPLLVILNDNTMSIEKNVGAMSTYLSRLRTEPTLYRFRRDLERRLQRLPGVGDKVAAMGGQLKDSIKAASCRACCSRTWASRTWASSTGTTSRTCERASAAPWRWRARCCCTAARSKARATRPRSSSPGATTARRGSR